ncbi:hypothetical protein [Microtetraspora malaysiensis]|uniref:hypothetical protein n=1 Tax=Microtetraspora malaysiensis TaxID=161358 RepID=UPI0012FAB0D3|nr:hypothetical protein [Microtetraspora malaysiensis]
MSTALIETRKPTLRLGALTIIIGALMIAGFRFAYGDLPAADPAAALHFITHHAFYAGVHLGTVLGVLLWTAGILNLARTFTHPIAVVLGRLALAAVLVGAAVFITDFTIDGVTGQDLAHAYATAAPADQPYIERVAQTAFTMLRGTSLVSIAILWAIPLMLLAPALRRDGYSSWLAWTGLLVGATSFLAAVALLFQSELFPGVLLYGLLASIVMPLWSIALGLTMWRHARTVS